LTGISAVGDALLVGLLFGSGEGDLAGAGELEGLGFGAGVADFFSVVTETLGSEEVEESFFRETDASGEASGAGLESSWARANEAPPIITATRVRMVNFICRSLDMV
jgi:hypothetical protein